MYNKYMEIAEIVKILKTKDSGIDLEQYLLLKLIDKYNIYDFKNEINNLEFKLQQLRINGYIDNNTIPEITEKCIKMFNKAIETPKSKYDFIALHKKLQDELVKLTGKKQVVIDKKYSFLLNFRDLEGKLLKVTKRYKLKDWNKIELLLLNYIDYCHKANWKYIKLLEYYIEKSGISQLATDYYNDRVEEKEEISQNNITFDGINI